MRRSLVVLILLLAALSSHCSRTDERQAPVQALLGFVGAIERSMHEPDYRKQAFAWLDDASKSDLTARASLARSLAGRELEGWEMLVPGRLHVTARDLRRNGLRADIDGDHARIELREGQSIELVREAAGWRVHLLPSPP